VSSTVLPLAGVVIGACGTLLASIWRCGGCTPRGSPACVGPACRTQRRHYRFLSAAERVEHRGQLALVPGHDAGDLIELMHAVWLAKKIIELVCSGTLAQAAQDYTHELNGASKELRPADAAPQPPALSTRERQLRAEFMEAARRELGYAGELLLRRTRADDMPEPSSPPEPSEMSLSVMAKYRLTYPGTISIARYSGNLGCGLRATPVRAGWLADLPGVRSEARRHH
jgi:hypothetical protein